MSVEQQEKGQDKGQAGALTGKTFGGYRVGDVLGSGGSASTVYVAEPTAGGDKVALRVFAADLSKDKNLSTRLVADVQKAVAVTHPNLVAVREVGAADFKGKRHLYIASERLEGESLKSRLAGKPDKPLELPRALHIASQVGAALQAIHRANGTHRQISSGSVFLLRASDGEEKVYLLDLGNALVPTSDSEKQGKGAKSGKVQDDVRGLALLVQEMLGGVGSDGAPGNQPVLPLRLRNAKVPARLDAVLRTALGDSLGAADRASRFDSVAGFVAALFGTGDTQPSFAAWSEDGRTMPRPRSAMSGNLLWGAAIIAILIGAVVGYWLYAQDTPPAAIPDLATVAPPPPAPVVEPKTAPPAPETNANGDGGARTVGHPGAWPIRTGNIPPLRDADPAPASTPSAPSAPGVTPPAVRAPVPAPAATPGGAGTGTPPAPSVTPPAVRAPVSAPAGGAGTGPQSAPAAPKTQAPAKPPAPPQGPGAPVKAPTPGPSGQKEVK